MTLVFARMSKFVLLLILSLLGVCYTQAGFAHGDEILFNTVNLNAQAERDIPNDQMTVVLVTEHDGSDAAKVAGKINQDMTWALAEIKKHAFAKSQTKGYQTWPLYNAANEISGWHAIQELEITGTDMEGVSALTGKLQERLQVRRMSFSPTNATRNKVENELIVEALHAFRERAEIVRKAMDEKHYRVVNLSVNTNGHQPPIFHERALAVSIKDASSPPAVEAGTSRMVVNVNGSVQYVKEVE